MSFSFMTVSSLTPACAHMRQLQKWDRLLPHPAESPDLAPSDNYLFGLVKDALCGWHLADDNKLKQSFCDAL
jgi:hypothetical protein